ncbi:MAG: capsule biosynthesis protein [Pseudomonadota bacterium]
MTTKPKARKFRIKRTTPTPSEVAARVDAEIEQKTAQRRAEEAANTAGAQQQPDQPARPTRPASVRPPSQQPSATGPASAEIDGTTAQPTHSQADDQAPSRVGEVQSAAEVSASTDIDEIRKEGLTGRQLRMARRLAQKHGLAPTSDFDAVRLLRAKGVDPFQRSNFLELVQPGQPAAESGDKVQLPQTVPVQQMQLPAVDGMTPAERRAQEITEIQRDIGRRRRRKLMLLLSRLAAFVLLPTLVVGYYFYFVATPMYTTKSEFLILTADGLGTSPSAGLFSGTAFATGQDSIATQSYLESKDAMLRLNNDVGFMDHFSQPNIDPIQRLDPAATNEEAYKVYRKYVKLGYDPTEGVIRMELSTSDPQVSKAFSETLIEYAEERVDQLSQEKRFDGLRTAEASLEDAKSDRRAAQRRLVELQEGSILDPEGEIANIRSLISNVELQLQEKELALNTQLNNARPNPARVAALRSEVAVLSAELTRQKSRLTEATEGTDSLAAQTAEIQMAQADLMTADLVLQSALETKRQTEIEANKQVRYLTVSVNPIASEDPSYPRKFENTLLAFLIFAGVYLMLSLTASILREQVSS